MKKFLERIFWIISFIILAWIGLSFIEVIVKNNTNPVYFKYNVFEMISVAVS